MNAVRIEKFQNGQEKQISRLIKQVYDEFVSPDYSTEGNQFFYDWIDPLKIAERQKGQRNILVALSGPEMVGVIEIRNNNTVSLLFVDKEYQRQGIAKRLFNEALKDCVQRNPTLKKVFVHASPFSIPIYKKLGFQETAPIQIENGIKYLPMQKELG